MLGFNKSDNAQILARDFVIKHNLNPKSTDNTALIQQIAAQITETQTGDEKQHAEALDLGKLVDEDERIRNDPFLSQGGVIQKNPGVTAVFNKKTGQVEFIHAPDLSEKSEEDLAKKREQERLAAERKKEKELRDRDTEAQRIKERIRAQRKDHDGPSLVPQPKNPTAGLVGGQSVQPRTLHDLSDDPASGKFRAAAGAAAVAAASHGGPVAGHSLSPGKPAAGAGGGGGAGRALPKKDWTFHYVRECMVQYGTEGVKSRMEEAGFTESEQFLLGLGYMQKKEGSVVEYLNAQRADLEDGADDMYPLNPTTNKKPHISQPATTTTTTAFSGQGHSLSSQDLLDDEHDAALNSNAEEEKVDDSEVVVDNSKATTQVAITLPGGIVKHGTFNLTHTVADLRRYAIREAQLRTNRFHLQLFGRPPTKLDDPSKTIEQANLQKARVNVILH